MKIFNVLKEVRLLILLPRPDTTHLLQTYNINYQVTDSAASANAFLSGVKTNDGTIGVNANVPRYSVDCDLIKSNSISSILKWALDSGLKSIFCLSFDLYKFI